MRKPSLRFLKKQKVWIPVTVIATAVVITGGVLWNYHEQPQFCATCHIMQPYLDSWESSGLLAHRHAEEGITCLECHEPTIGQQLSEVIKFITGNYETPLSEAKFPEEWCLQCHEHESYEQIIELTEGLVEEVGRNPHDSHYGDMRCGICHNMHRPSEDFCTQCHFTVDWGESWISP